MLTRHREPELMDDPSLNRQAHAQALEGLATLNALSGSASVLWQPLKNYATQTGLRQLKILDLATGSADVALRLWRFARYDGLDMTVDGCDISDTAIDYARDRAARLRATSSFFKLDILNEDLPDGYDVIMCSQFLHHLSDAEVVRVLTKMGRSTNGMVLVSDLVRSRPNLCMVTIASRMFSRSPVVHFDGPASVRAAFTPEEMSDLASRAGLTGASVQERFPCRLLMTWRKSVV